MDTLQQHRVFQAVSDGAGIIFDALCEFLSSQVCVHVNYLLFVKQTLCLSLMIDIIHYNSTNQASNNKYIRHLISLLYS